MFYYLEGKLLDKSDLTLLRAYTLKVEDGITNATFNKLRFAFPQAPLDSIKSTEKRVQFLSGFQPVRYACCISSCVCFTGPFETLQQCPKCKADRYKADGTTPRSYFEYLPIIPRLRAMVANSKYAEKMQYWSNHMHDPTKVTDIFDGTHYTSLLGKFVTIGDEQLPMWFFSDPRDIALGLSTDGFGPFKRRNKAAWPLILFNYNLPPEGRFRKENIISLGSIPKKPLDFDSFIWPLVQELLQLAVGVTAFDALSRVIFLLHAYLIVVFGDIPAISMVMRMKGHNAIVPCRMCEIQGIRKPGTNTYYVPLHRSSFPGSPDSYNPSVLPLRDHASFLEQAETVQSASTTNDFDRLSTMFGIKGVPLLSTLSSLSFPTSFPYDFMHLIWANLIPNLILLWTGKFKNLDHDGQDYVIMQAVWNLIGEATFQAGETIPAAFGSRVLNIALEKAHIICETYSIWTLYLAPILLKGRFLNERYYNHFMKLVQLLLRCIDFEITQEQIDDLDQNFQDWVQDYERYVLPTSHLDRMAFNSLLGSTINMIRIMFRVAQSPSMPCYISHQPSGLWARSGPTGPFRWNATAVMSFATSGVDGSPIQASTDM